MSSRICAKAAVGLQAPFNRLVGGLPSTGRAEAQIFAAALLAGSGWLFSKNALHELPPLLFIGSRFLVAGLVIGLFIRLPSRAPARRDSTALVCAVAAMALSMIGWIIALQHTRHIGVAAFITASGNLMVPFVGAALFGWPLLRSLVLSVSLALGGFALLLLDRSSVLDVSHLLFFVSAIFWAISITCVKNSSAQIGLATWTSIQLCAVGLIILIASFFLESWPQTTPSLPTIAWFSLSVLLSTSARFLLQFNGQKAVPPARAAMLMAIEPVVTMVLAITLLGSTLSIAQLGGCLLIFAAIISETRSAGKTTSA